MGEKDVVVTLSVANEQQRAAIYQKRHQVFALELQQHQPNTEGRLSDALDDHNLYVVATRGAEVQGFVSITPPGSPSFAIDKYFKRVDLPVTIDEHVGEIRLLVVDRELRGNGVAYLLLYAAYRLCRSLDATVIVGTGHSWITDLYRSVGMETPGLKAPSGQLVFDLVVGRAEILDAKARGFLPMFRTIAEATRVDWQLPFPFEW